jgi:sugar phosphate isomerase/epimerase
MKIGICASTENAALLAPGVIDYVELNLKAIAEMPSQVFSETKKLLASKGVKAECANGFFPGTIPLVGPALDLGAVKEYTRGALDRARDIGITTCVLGSGKARKVPEGFDPSDALKQFEEVAYAVGDIAKANGVTVVIEPLNRKETNLINSVAEGAALCRRLSHPNVLLLADLYHVALENEPLSAISANGDIIKHIHIAYPEGRTAPLPSDGYDYSALARELKKAGYDLRVSIEGRIPDNYAGTVAASAAFLKSVF